MILCSDSALRAEILWHPEAERVWIVAKMVQPYLREYREGTQKRPEKSPHLAPPGVVDRGSCELREFARYSPLDEAISEGDAGNPDYPDDHSEDLPSVHLLFPP